MKPYEVALFKHFIDGKGMTTVYINLFRNFPLKANPTSIEKFLRIVDPDEVCVKAFYFLCNARFGYDYWKMMQKSWLEFLDKHKDDAEADEWYNLHGYCKILRCNWDAKKHWKQESRVATANRLGITLPEFIDLGDEDEKENTSNGNDDNDNGNVTEEPTPVVGDDEQEKADEKADDILGEFNILDLRPRTHISRRLKDDEVSLNFRNKKSTLTFNQKLSREFRERGGYEYAALGKNAKGEVCLMLNDENGVPMLDGKVATETHSETNAAINSQVFGHRLEALLDITEEYSILKVKEIAHTETYVAYLITK